MPPERPTSSLCRVKDCTEPGVIDYDTEFGSIYLCPKHFEEYA